MVSGSVEYYTRFPGSPSDKQLLNRLAVTGNETKGPTFIRLTGAALCVDKSGDWTRMTQGHGADHAKSTVQKVGLWTEAVDPQPDGRIVLNRSFSYA